MNNFLPEVGNLLVYKVPQGNGVRVDDGFEQGMEIPIYYDSMISKLITHGKDRTEAIEKMLRAINDYKIVGVETTLEFCNFVLTHPQFVSGNFDTGFIKNYFQPEMLNNHNTEFDELAAIAGSVLFKGNKTDFGIVNNQESVKKSKWKANRL
jgi:propionyl-CoA carboxylase alpha chain